MEEVDVLLPTADNIRISVTVRIDGHPPVRGLGEADRYVDGTVEVLSFPWQGYENQTKEMR